MIIRWALNVLIICASLVMNVDLLVADGDWKRKADMPTARGAFATSVVNGKVFAMGGHVNKFGDRSIATVEMYNPETDTWERRADMPTARANVSTSVVDGKIYAIGGEKIKKIAQGNGWINMYKALPTVEMYDPVTDTWTQKADMPTPRMTSTGVVDGKIYAIGRETNEVYDPATDTWAEAKDMNHPREWLTTSVVGGKIYAMGGTGWPQGQYLSSVEVFDPKTNQWSEKADMPRPKASHAASVVNGKIYVMGGFLKEHGVFMDLATIEIYDPATDRWKQEGDMPIGKWDHTAEAIKGKIYVFGGDNLKNPGEPFVTVEAYDTGEVPQSVEPTGKLTTTWGQLKQ